MVIAYMARGSLRSVMKGSHSSQNWLILSHIFGDSQEMVDFGIIGLPTKLWKMFLNIAKTNITKMIFIIDNLNGILVDWFPLWNIEAHFSQSLQSDPNHPFPDFSRKYETEAGNFAYCGAEDSRNSNHKN